MDEFAFNQNIPEKPKESEVKSNKKDIKFQEIPKFPQEMINKDNQNVLIKKYLEEQPIAIPLEENRTDNHLSLILSPNLRELELMIRGLEYVKRFNPLNGRDEVVLRKIEGHPLNEYGINKIMELIKVWSSSELKLGRRRPKDAIESAQQIGKDARRLIYKNLKNFGMDTQVKQRSAKTYTLAIFEFAYSALSRSIEGKENDMSRPTEFSIQSNTDTGQINYNPLNKAKKEELKN